MHSDNSFGARVTLGVVGFSLAMFFLIIGAFMLGNAFGDTIMRGEEFNGPFALLGAVTMFTGCYGVWTFIPTNYIGEP